MTADLRAIRNAFDHSGVKGTAAEEIVAEFLNARLPGSARAVAGQVIDHTGQRSRQIDVVVYDATRTPMLFASKLGTQNLVPAEGVIAVVEVKMRLTLEELRTSVLNCASVKQLERSALAKNQVFKEFNLYGTVWLIPPIYYSLFAFESNGLYAEALNDQVGQELQQSERIDSVVCMDRGVCLNASASVVGKGDDVTVDTYFTAASDAHSVKMNIETDNALAVWYGFFMSTVLDRIPGPEIDITWYLKDELQVSGQLGSGPSGQAMAERIRRELAAAVGIDPELAQKFTNQSISPAEMYELIQHPMFHPSNEATSQQVEHFRKIQLSARTSSREEWLELWFAGQNPDQPIRS
jgi:hypothetical protein